jgi:hypothetical protein
VGLLRTSDQPNAETSTWQHTTDICASGGIRTHDLSRPTATDVRHRPRGPWDRQWTVLVTYIRYKLLNSRYILKVFYE